MNSDRRRPGEVRDSIRAVLAGLGRDATIAEIQEGVEARLGAVPASSIRSSLNLTSDLFERTERGKYRLVSP